MLFSLDPLSATSLQEQLRSNIVAAILAGHLAPGASFPSTRELARKNDVSRTTAVLVYDKLVEDGFLVARDRSGYFISSEPQSLPIKSNTPAVLNVPNVDWDSLFAIRPTFQRNITKPKNWQSYRYPFVYGQPDPSLFPLAAWRECSRQAMSELSMRSWANDAISEDDPDLIHEIKTKLLPKRGIYTDDANILITAGAQNGLYLIASLLMNNTVRVAVEDPGYPDARNIFALHGAELTAMKFDRDGPVLDQSNRTSDYFFITPSHHSPTTITMSQGRRQEFLNLATEQGKIIIEDDFESDFNYLEDRVPAIKAADRSGRVLYIGSLSKSMFPGLRLGYVVADAEVIDELRALRRLMMRHVPSNNQRTTSLFIAQGHHESYLRKLNRIYTQRAEIMKDCLKKYFPNMSEEPAFGGTSYWLTGPKDLDSQQLAVQALDKGIVIEPGAPHFMQSDGNQHYIRLGFSSIRASDIEPGFKILSGLMVR